MDSSAHLISLGIPKLSVILSLICVERSNCFKEILCDLVRNNLLCFVGI